MCACRSFLKPSQHEDYPQDFFNQRMSPDKFSIFKWFLIAGTPPRKRVCEATVLGKDRSRCFSRFGPTVLGPASIRGSCGIIG